MTRLKAPVPSSLSSKLYFRANSLFASARSPPPPALEPCVVLRERSLVSLSVGVRARARSLHPCGPRAAARASPRARRPRGARNSSKQLRLLCGHCCARRHRVVLRRRSKRHSPSRPNRRTTSRAVAPQLRPWIALSALAAFCGMLVSYRPLAKLRHQSSPKRRGIPIRRRFGFESRTRLAPRLVRQPSQHSGCLPWPSTKHRGSQRKREREPGLRRRRGSGLSSSAHAGQPPSQARAATHAAGAAPAPRGRRHRTHQFR